MELVLHQSTKKELDDFINSPSHALLILGPHAVGKEYVALHLASVLFKENRHEQDAYQKIIRSDETKSIGIDTIRELDQFLKLKVPIKKEVNRIVIIINSHEMTEQAQNALLKTLESPPQNTVFILTASHTQSLLPTIISRVQKLVIRRPDRTSLELYFQNLGFDSVAIAKALSISGGLPALSASILDQDEHYLSSAIDLAKEILPLSLFEKLAKIDSIYQDKDLCRNLLYILQQMAHVQLLQNKTTVTEKWKTILIRSVAASDALRANASYKLVLTDFMLHL